MNRGIEFSFSWLFSLLVGGVILFLALYASKSLVQTERQAQESELGVELTNVFTPLRTGGAETLIPRAITFPQPVAITLRCTPQGTAVRVAARDNLAGRSEPYESLVRDSFVSGNITLQGKRVMSLVLPVALPYHVGDLIVLWSGSYCFIDPPDSVRERLELADNETIRIAPSLAHCAPQSTKVCFAGSASPKVCDIRIDSVSETLTFRGGKPQPYTGNLLYAGLFGTADQYECLVRQVAQQTALLGERYRTKSAFISSGQTTGCAGGMEGVLNTYVLQARAVNGSQGLPGLASAAEHLAASHDSLLCPLWWKT